MLMPCQASPVRVQPSVSLQVDACVIHGGYRPEPASQDIQPSLHCSRAAAAARFSHLGTV